LQLKAKHYVQLKAVVTTARNKTFARILTSWK